MGVPPLSNLCHEQCVCGRRPIANLDNAVGGEPRRRPCQIFTSQSQLSQISGNASLCLNVFVISAIARTIPIAATYRGVLPYIVADVIRLALVVAFPAIALWLVKALD